MRVVVMGMGRLGRSLHQLLNEIPHFEALSWRREEPIPEKADVYWICVSDQAVAEVAAQVPLGKVVLHASGALDIDVLRPHSPAGSLHPLQTFPGPETRIPNPANTPAAIAGDPEAVQKAMQIAGALGFQHFELQGDRRAYHAAAVIAGNFATLLIDQASLLLQDAGVDPSNAPALLAPLARSSIEQAATGSPLSSLTGPLARSDLETLQRHLNVLQANRPEMLDMYRILSRTAGERLHAENQLTTEDLEALIRLLG